MDPEQEKSRLFVCPPTSRHFFREIRTRSKIPGPPFYLNLRCKNCTAILTQIVDYKRQPNGDIIPSLHSYLLYSGKRVDLPNNIYLILRPDFVKDQNPEIIDNA